MRRAAVLLAALAVARLTARLRKHAEDGQTAHDHWESSASHVVCGMELHAGVLTARIEPVRMACTQAEAIADEPHLTLFVPGPPQPGDIFNCIF